MINVNIDVNDVALLREAIECRYEAAVGRYEDGQDSNEDMQQAEDERKRLLDGLKHYPEK